MGLLARPLLLVVDEFAALRNPNQILELLTQAREADVRLVVGTQFLPAADEHDLRGALLGAGLLIVHKMGSGQGAEDVARTLGEYERLEVVRQFGPPDPVSGQPPSGGSVRSERAFRVLTETLQNLARGQAVVHARYGAARTAIVRIEPLMGA